MPMIPEPIRQLASPGGVVAIALCLLFPFVWDRFDPALEAETTTVMLTPKRPRVQLDVPDSAIHAVAGQSRDFGPRTVKQFRFALPNGGRFSLYGVSSSSVVQPVNVLVNEQLVSTTAFYQRTGSYRKGFETHLLARGVRFDAGQNHIALSGDWLKPRTFAVGLRREVPLNPGRYAALFAVAAVVVLLRSVIASRLQLGARARLTVAILAYAGIVFAGFPAALWLGSDGDLSALGESDPPKVVALREFDRTLRSPEHLESLRERFSVAVLGDSTHVFALPKHARMLPTLARSLPEQDAYYWFGTAGGAYSAFDFYLLANAMKNEPPDLVVAPVSLRSFAPAWFLNPGYRVRDLDHYLALSELWRSRSLSVGGRDVPVGGWVLRGTDAVLFAGDAERLLRGAKIFARLETERHASRFAARLGWSFNEELPEERFSGWEPHIAADHEMFDAFRLLNDLAARTGFEILYYTVQPNAQAQMARGRDIRVWENFELIERQITGAPGIHFLALREPIPQPMYRDDIDHLHPQGIEHVAAQIARKVAEIRASRSAR